MCVPDDVANILQKELLLRKELGVYYILICIYPYMYILRIYMCSIYTIKYLYFTYISQELNCYRQSCWGARTSCCLLARVLLARLKIKLT